MALVTENNIEKKLIEFLKENTNDTYHKLLERVNSNNILPNEIWIECINILGREKSHPLLRELGSLEQFWRLIVIQALKTETNKPTGHIINSLEKNSSKHICKTLLAMDRNSNFNQESFFSHFGISSKGGSFIQTCGAQENSICLANSPLERMKSCCLEAINSGSKRALKSGSAARLIFYSLKNNRYQNCSNGSFFAIGKEDDHTILSEIKNFSKNDSELIKYQSIVLHTSSRFHWSDEVIFIKVCEEFALALNSKNQTIH